MLPAEVRHVLDGPVHQPLGGRVAPVTGSSRGIGRAIALEPAYHGADIVVNYLRKRSAAGEVIAGIEDKGRRAIDVRANVGNVADTQAMIVDTDALKCFPIDVSEALREGTRRTPAGRVATPEDVATG